METLRYLAGRLGKSVSFFLEEDAVFSPNCKVMERARVAFGEKDLIALRSALDGYRSPDPVFEEEWKRLTIHCLVLEAEEALRTGREIYARELLDRAEEVAQTALYFTEELSGKILLLKGRLKSADLGEICRKLPSLDEHLILRARGALAAGGFVRCLHLLEAAEEQDGADWNFLRGELYLTERDYAQAAKCFHQAEEVMGQAVFAKLEICYRELGDYQMAYTYACKQKMR